MNGERLNSLSVDDLQYFETRFFLVPGTGTVYVDAKLSVIRQRAVGNGFHEELTILNHLDEPVESERPRSMPAAISRICSRSRTRSRRRASTPRASRAASCVLAYDRATFGRSTVISASAPARIDKRRPELQDPDRGSRCSGARDLDVVTRASPGDEPGRETTGDPKRSQVRMRREPGALDRRRASTRVPTRIRSRRRTDAASSISLRCASRR